MSALCVRPATSADSDAIGLVRVRSWQSAYQGKISQDYLDGLDPACRAQVWRCILEQDQSPRGGVLVAVAEGGGITGFASFGPSRDSDTDPRVTGEVFAIYAAPDAWGTGTGRALMDSAVAELARAGYSDGSCGYWTPTTGHAGSTPSPDGRKTDPQDRREPRLRHH
jgi:GNAT superfamily N-acetyltransferase